MAKNTKEVTKDILDVEFENISKEKLFDDNGYMEDQDSAREDEDDMEDSTYMEDEEDKNLVEEVSVPRSISLRLAKAIVNNTK